jgi:Ca2+-binding RTX toxin-like protein
MTAPFITVAIDDVSPKTGEVHYGEYTNDTSPIIMVALGDQAASGQMLTLADNGAAIGSGVTLSAAQIAQGYVDVPVSSLGQGWNLLNATITAPGGAVIGTSPSFALGVSTTTPATPTITAVSNDAAAAIANGAHTDDATPTFQIFEPGLPPPPTSPPGHAPYGGPPLLSGHIQLYEGDHLVGDAMIGFGGTVTITADALAPGGHTLTAVAIDLAGNVSAPSAPFQLFVDAANGGAAVTYGVPLQASPDAPLVQGTPDADIIVGMNANDVLLGGAGDDSITGGTQFNDVNGNQGNDTIVGRSLVGDFLMGGQGADSIDASQSSGHNLVNGNKGADTVVGGSGGDTLRGGQGDDLITGGAGADWLSGDRGHNTLAGGGGADTFHAGAGSDLVTDFNAAQGDRVVVDGVFVVSQSGPDTVIDVTGEGGQMILAGVSSASLPSGWILQV